MNSEDLGTIIRIAFEQAKHLTPIDDLDFTEELTVQIENQLQCIDIIDTYYGDSYIKIGVEKIDTDECIITYKGKKYKYIKTWSSTHGHYIEHCLLHENGDKVLNCNEILDYIHKILALF